LYAGHHPVFVVDAYTRRILERHQIVSEQASYEEIRELVEQALQEEANGMDSTLRHFDAIAAAGTGRPNSSHRPSRVSAAKRSEIAQAFNEMHGLIVGVGKTYCLKSQPRCELCPLQKFLPQAK
jgi:endonuclease III related protein